MLRAAMLATSLALALMGLSSSSGDDAGCDHALATCTGDTPCKACKNCSKCVYCKKKGGYCGVCSQPAKPETD